MRAGQLKYLLTFQRQVEIKDKYSSTVTSYQDVYTCKAALLKNSNKRFINDLETFNQFTYTFQIRYNPLIDYNLRVVYNNNFYNIELIEPIGYDLNITVTKINN